MLNWKSLGFGIAIAVVMYFMFISYNLQYLVILSFIIAPLIGGYIVGGSPKTGAIHGAVINFVGSIVAILLFAALLSYYSNIPVSLGANIIALIVVFFIYAAIGAVFGVVGALISNRLMKKQ